MTAHDWYMVSLCAAMREDACGYSLAEDMFMTTPLRNKLRHAHTALSILVEYATTLSTLANHAISD
jgi:hypothetical protein